METTEQLKEQLRQELEKLIARRDAGENLQHVIDKFIHALANYETVSLAKDTLNKSVD